ncbi:MBL fold metallo-hydrolase [Actinocrispum wychmicini]|uniref:Glyoxylase-like metal-dependent hydrolase (Beta-lactamase superfamily II) n=1 Tax=Actinocrispum wychmicini TaxID=1213861 RepID=A0A4R2J2Z7_9PSEU|nr:MBL fold metallo-hydrolase [Actinocrispum wychmicini]TCO50699.1 glyoxylase-like metal-dependent hydrolase (beta-lactamase superfamily II) [Actinocrispum wychmicini]
MIEFRRIVVGPLATNCWVLHSSGAALLVDPGDDPDRVLAAVADLDVTAILLTHAHFDHVMGVDAVATALDVPVLGHRAEEDVWRHELTFLKENGHFDAGLDTAKLLAEGVPLTPNTSLWHGTFDRYVTDTVRVGPVDVRVLHTPGHTPGGVTLALPGHLFTGDTLFPGGPGLTGWPLSDFRTIIESVRGLLDFPEDTVIHPGHGPDTTVGTEKPALPDWIARGW